jgi:phosphoribosylglycinamide formyltransferase-1
VVARVAVLASGTGTNLQALLDDDVVGPQIVVVLSDRANAKALDRARERGVEAVFLDPAAFQGRAAYDEAVLEQLHSRRIDAVALAGFMRVVGTELVGAFEGRMLNVHPSLLPAFPGAHPVADALEWGAKVTGVTVHVVDDQIDHGPIVAQAAVDMAPGDTWDSLEERIHEVEHRLFPAAMRALVQGRLRLEGRSVRIEEER